MQREAWTSLNGEWQFSKGREKLYVAPGEVEWDAQITVPFSPETEASGVKDTGYYTAVWYRRTWVQAKLPVAHRLLVHFEAVDWRATVWINGKIVCSHEGGYTPFSADITEALVEGSAQKLWCGGQRTNLPTSRSLEGKSRTGSSNRMLSGTRVLREFGRQSGWKR